VHAFFNLVNLMESANQAVREVSEAIRDAVELGR
jgi:hypothetical protein